jgi:hypothetical protein
VASPAAPPAASGAGAAPFDVLLQPALAVAAAHSDAISHEQPLLRRLGLRALAAAPFDVLLQPALAIAAAHSDAISHEQPLLRRLGLRALAAARAASATSSRGR